TPWLGSILQPGFLVAYVELRCCLFLDLREFFDLCSMNMPRPNILQFFRHSPPVAMPEAREGSLLSSFPRPPPRPNSFSPTISTTPSRVYQASDFGFIPLDLGMLGHKSYINEPEERIDTPTSASPANEESAPFGLVIDNPTRLYAPGDTITGYVVGLNAHTFTRRVHLILEGRAKISVTVGGQIEYRERALLLYHVLPLQPQRYCASSRFSIKIPIETQQGLEHLNGIDLRAVQGYSYTHNWPSQEGFESTARHPLPPSTSVPIPTSNTLRVTPTTQGYVEYKLSAVRSRSKGGNGRLILDCICSVPITITTLRMSSNELHDVLIDKKTVVQDLFVKTPQLSQDRRFSIREQLREPVTSSTLTLYMRSNISIPKTSVPGAGVQLVLSLAVLPPPAAKLYDFAIPEVTVTSFSCSVKSYQGLRMSHINARSTPIGGQLKFCTIKEVEYSTSMRTRDTRFRPRNGGFDGQSCTFTVHLPATLVPSFKTYNMWRAYRLKAKFMLVVAGKEVMMHVANDLSIVARATEGAERLLASDSSMHIIEQEEQTLSMEMAKAVLVTHGPAVEGPSDDRRRRI
ncbi:hypothetical protein EJ04DRAFT_602046, partial [Polyplosphaeria fusca]